MQSNFQFLKVDCYERNREKSYNNNTVLENTWNLRTIITTKINVQITKSINQDNRFYMK